MQPYISEFPILKSNTLTYLDSASTTLKPFSVIKAIEDYYTLYSANVHRGLYSIAEQATEEYEQARQLVAEFIHAATSSEVIFTRGTTESINMVACCLPIQGKNIVTTVLEHHSNFVPWQQLALSSQKTFDIVDMVDPATALANLQRVVTKHTSVVALQHASNVTGAVQPLKQIIQDIRSINKDTIIVVDAAQSVPHMKVDVQDLDCDFLVFSGHKMYGPTGIGVLWGKSEHLQRMHPWHFGGDMVREVDERASVFYDAPQKFEAGTPHVAGAIGLAAAIHFMKSLNLDEVGKHERALTESFIAHVKGAFGGAVTVYSAPNPDQSIGIAALSLRDCHAHDIAGILAEDGVAIRAGHHCAQPLHKRLGETATARFCFSLYNTEQDVEKAVASLKRAYSLLT